MHECTELIVNYRVQKYNTEFMFKVHLIVVLSKFSEFWIVASHTGEQTGVHPYHLLDETGVSPTLLGWNMGPPHLTRDETGTPLDKTVDWPVPTTPLDETRYPSGWNG